jgi:hypothetical protein
MPQTNSLARLSRQPLLITESPAEFKARLHQLETEIAPRGYIEKMYVRDIAAIDWEITRLRGAKAAILNIAFPSALKALLAQLMRKPGEWSHHVDKPAETLAKSWFTSEQAKADVAELLHRFGLDLSAVEAEAISQRAPELEMLERMLASLEVRRNRLLLAIEDHRASFAQPLRASSDRVIDGKLPRPRATLNKPRPAA